MRGRGRLLRWLRTLALLACLVLLMLAHAIVSDHVPMDARRKVDAVFTGMALLLIAVCAGDMSAEARRKYRATHGLCLTCGYDLRSSPTRCPECGTPTAGRGAALASGPGAD